MRRVARAIAVPILVGLAPVASAGCRLLELARIPVTLNGLAPTVPARINGADAAFLLDSGATRSVLSRAAAAQFKLHIVDEAAHPSAFDLAEREGLGRVLERAPTRLVLEGVGGGSDIASATVDRFTLFNVPFHHVQFVVGGTAPAGVTGLVGEDLLRLGAVRPDVEYDLASGMVRLMRPEGCGGSTLAYWATSETYSVIETGTSPPDSPVTTGTALLNGARIRVIFDTGTPRSIVSLHAAARAGITPRSAGVEPAGRAYGIGPQSIPTWIAPFERLELGSEIVHHVELRIGDLGPFTGLADMVIGADFFLSHRVYVARSQGRLYFTYNGGPVFDPGSAPRAAAIEDSAPAQPGTAEPADAAGFALRGAAFAARREFHRAIADLTRACELDPTEPGYFYERGLTYWSDSQPASALADFDHALTLQPNDVSALIARAELRLTKHDAAARADLDAASRWTPQQAGVRLTLANLYQRLALFTPAVAQYDLWIAAHPGDARMAVALEGRGLAESRLGNLEAAVADYDLALERQPQDAWALYGRGLARLRQGKRRLGSADIAAATALQPDIAEDARKRGLVP